ncbi:MAG: ABC transporter permease [Ktedonobacteraceae bacterium]|nr:ABC transporter permease [Ktedonobacteraceae bacterium]
MNTTLHPPARVTQTRSPLTRFGWTIADTWIMTRRDLAHWRLRPGTAILGWFFPVMIVLMFGFLFGGAISVPGGGNYFEFLMPGMFATTMLFGLETTMIAVTTDASKGVTDRFRSLPMSASAVVLGRCLADLVNSMIGLAILIGVGLMLGWRWHGGLSSALTAVGLLLLLRFALLWVGIFCGLKARGPESVTSVQILVWPISFLSNVFVDPSTMPPWLGIVAQWNPLSATAGATRNLFMNPGWQMGSWISEHAGLMAVVYSVLLIALFLPLSVRIYRRLSR